MLKVLFVCHGNICRSTMAQSMFQDIVNKKGLSDKFEIDSAATSREEIGNGPHYGTIGKLREVGIPVVPHRARQMTRADYDKYDYLIGMDSYNVSNMTRIAGGDPDGKIYSMLSFAGLNRSIADPWYTDNFDETYNDLRIGLDAFWRRLSERGI
ncbi:MAG: low molecular weight phosphotyrosine protein phosphatase [Saccharofermentans sp.]|nr:low molecular weight phosphotyrosine protein phosphatase [Saccharofermentans sp.]